MIESTILPNSSVVINNRVWFGSPAAMFMLIREIFGRNIGLS